MHLQLIICMLFSCVAMRASENSNNNCSNIMDIEQTLFSTRADFKMISHNDNETVGLILLLYVFSILYNKSKCSTRGIFRFHLFL